MLIRFVPLNIAKKVLVARRALAGKVVVPRLAVRRGGGIRRVGMTRRRAIALGT